MKSFVLVITLMRYNLIGKLNIFMKYFVLIERSEISKVAIKMSDLFPWPPSTKKEKAFELLSIKFVHYNICSFNCSHTLWLVSTSWFGLFYGISTLVGHLIPIKFWNKFILNEYLIFIINTFFYLTYRRDPNRHYHSGSEWNWEQWW